MSNSGYIYVNLGELDFLLDLDSEQTIDGLYTSLTEAVNSNKPIIGVNALYNSADLSPVQMSAYVDDSSIVCISGIYTITVTSEDGATIVNTAG